MFTFVFLWTPSLSEHKYRVPLGFIFASFMLAIVCGSTAFQLALTMKWSVEQCLEMSIQLAIASFVVTFVFDSPSILFLAFVGFEFSCGVYFPAIGSLRGEILPEADRAGIMGWFRVPLNLVVVVLLFASHVLSHHMLFGACAVLCTLALLVHRRTMHLMREGADGGAVNKYSGYIHDGSPVRPLKGSPFVKEAGRSAEGATMEGGALDSVDEAVVDATPSVPVP
eukprot:m.1351536 g.1351536  ORF g.1351536 m.1351536 type:complete len:225 (-) comp24923_c0_seq20:3633-4307(-)